MKRGAIRSGMLALALLTSPVASPDSSAAMAQGGQAIDRERLEAAANALRDADERRLTRDRDYAEEMVGHLDMLSAATDSPDALLALDVARLVVLLPLDREEEVALVLDRVLAARPIEAGYYSAAWWAALTIADHPRAVAVVAQASQLVRGPGWAELRRDLGEQAPWMLLQALRERGDSEQRARLAGALFRIGWPGDGDVESADALRRILLDEQLRRGDRAAAADLAGGVTTPGAVLPLITLRRYDGLIADDADPIARLRAAIAEYDRTSAAAIVRQTPHLGRLLQRAQFLNMVGRAAEAWALLEPYTRDIPATVAEDMNGMWLVNEAVSVLASLGRETEAIELSRGLAAIPLEENTSLIGPHINHASNLNKIGSYEEALAYARRLDTESSRTANDYGRMLIWRAIVCALAAQGRAEEAAPTMEALRAADDANPLALIDAHLCLNDMDAAEARLIGLLESDDPVAAVITLQDYELDAGRPGSNPWSDRAEALRNRPAVRAALLRVGYLYALPLANGGWR